MYVRFWISLLVPPPQIITQPKNTTAADPFGAHFTCSANGYGKITIDWYNENVQEDLPPKVIISEEHSLESVTSVLFIPHVTLEDEGGYFCSVKIGKVSTKSSIAYLDQISKYKWIYYNIIQTKEFSTHIVGIN